MRLRTEMAATIIGFVAINLLLILAAIGLFVRMGPAIDRILRRNDASIVAAEAIVEVLARTGHNPIAAPDRAGIRAAVARAQDNITEPGEAEVLQGMQAALPGALIGETDARQALIDQLHQLIAINRTAMRQVDQSAQSLGNAGAWTAMFVGLITLALSLFLTRSLGRRVVYPVQELRETLASALSGDRIRRCSTPDAASDLREAMDLVNQLLDGTTPPLDAYQGSDSAAARSYRAM